jgi:integrase
MSRGQRTRIATNVFRDASGISAIVRVRGHAPKELRFQHGTALKDIRKDMERWAARMHTARPTPSRGTLAADAATYERLTRHLASWRERRSEVRALVRALGDKRRSQILKADVLDMRTAWLQAGVAPKTCNNRIWTMGNLYRVLDGKNIETPCDEIDDLPIHRTPIQRVSDETILAVDAKLQEHERRGWLRNAKTRARYRVMVSFGRRPSEIARTQPTDVDLDQRVWVPRDGKGGFTPGLYLNDDQLAAWRLFAEANAWGDFNESSFVRTLRTAGWPEGVRPYQSRHTLGITLSESGIDLDDVGAALGHKRRETTRKHYVPVLGSRMQALSESLSGRFNGWNRVEPQRGTDEK